MYKAFIEAKKTLRTRWKEIDQLVVNVEEEMRISPMSPQAKAKREKKARQKAAKLAAAVDGTGSPTSLKSLGSKSSKKKKKRKGGDGSTEINTSPSPPGPPGPDRERPYGDSQERPSIEVQDVDDDTQAIDIGSPSFSPMSMSTQSPLFSPPLRSLVSNLPPSPVEPSFFPSSQLIFFVDSTAISTPDSVTLPNPIQISIFSFSHCREPEALSGNHILLEGCTASLCTVSFRPCFCHVVFDASNHCRCFIEGARSTHH